MHDFAQSDGQRDASRRSGERAVEIERLATARGLPGQRKVVPTRRKRVGNGKQIAARLVISGRPERPRRPTLRANRIAAQRQRATVNRASGGAGTGGEKVVARHAPHRIACRQLRPQADRPRRRPQISRHRVGHTRCVKAKRLADPTRREVGRSVGDGKTPPHLLDALAVEGSGKKQIVGRVHRQRPNGRRGVALDGWRRGDRITIHA